ncbi:MAG: hypothetical protein KatS3mg044_0528 [Rhodothermaceae bacterium]|nr:MAG: hypothetical protein KatS3mg044_0528 [Rhodothermaceae bacterium]
MAVLCMAVAAAAQPSQFSAGFERDINRYRWTAGLEVHRPLGAWTLRLSNQFSSDAFILFADRLSFRDENRMAWEAERPLRPGLDLHLHGRADWYSLSRVFSPSMYAGVRFRAGPQAWVEPMAGLAVDQRPGAVIEAGASPPLRTDAGPAVGLRAGYLRERDGSGRFGLEGETLWQFITPRRGRVVRLRGRYEQTFEQTRLTSEVVLASFRRDAYQAVSFLNRNVPTDRRSETVEATTSDTLAGFVEVSTPLVRGVRLLGRIDMALNDRFSRTLRAPEGVLFFDTDFNRRTFDMDVGLLYDTPDLLARLALRAGAEVERRDLANAPDLPDILARQNRDLLLQADFDRGHLTLQGQLRATLNRFLALQLEGSASTLRHDTPDINPDDRDEILYSGSAGVLVRLSRYLQADVQLYGSYFHTVYLKALRSAENNVQRSLRLRPALQWTPAPGTRLRFTSEVRATYTVDDFVLTGRRPTDQAARELRYDLHLEHTLAPDVAVEVEGGASDLQLGRFLDDVFAEIPFDTLRTYRGWVRLRTGRRIAAEVGLRFFIRSDYDRATTVRYERLDEAGNVVRDENGLALTTTITRPGRMRIEQLGPTTSIVWSMRGGSALRLDGWLTIQHVRRFLYGTLPEDDAARIRAAGRRGTRTLIPNLAVTALWRF